MKKSYPIPSDMSLWEKYIKNFKSNPISRTIFNRPQENYPKILDLHGFVIDDGYQMLRFFLEKHYNLESRMVLVITGNNQTGQSFKNKVPRWLQEAPFTTYIASYKQAEPNQGGAGALVIYLKKNPLTK